MPVVCFVSPKGGVGKTMLAANVAVALHRIGWRVLAVDFDPQNALRMHFDLPQDEVRGIASEVAAGRDWTELVMETPSGIFLIPFGVVSGSDGLAVQSHVAANSGWIQRQLAPFTEHRDLVVVADLPPGYTPYLAELGGFADLRLATLLADAMSLAYLPKLRGGKFLEPGSGRIGYVLNKLDRRRHLCRDVLALSEDVLGADLYGTIREDEAVAEAVACQLTVLDYAPEGAASYDVTELAKRVDSGIRPATAGGGERAR